MRGRAQVRVLAVGDDGLNVGNSDGASCGSCRRRTIHMRELREITWMSKPVSRLRFPGILGEPCEDIS